MRNGISFLIAATLMLGAVPAHAKDGVDVWAELSARAVDSSRAVFEGDDIDSSGVGVAAAAGFEWKNGRTSVQFDLGAQIFDYSEDTRETRESATASATLAQELNDTLSVAVTVSHAEDIVTLEARETDQDAVRVEVKYETKQDRLRLRAQYRAREYRSSTIVDDQGEGFRYDAQYNRRIGSWHWARLDVQFDDIDSDTARRSYHRMTVRGSYSLPVAKKLRLRPQLEYRSWTYDERRVLGDPASELRQDSYVAPEIGLDYGGSSGLRARLRAAYQFRTSNDPRYSDDAPYLDLTIGYRF
ncbi:hypothetical protein [Qipengyuania marisflavi]|uniref:DUF481 domain-containing protein n=1 Tax=Qipengyuania marisflavi TaxID=2486356 RepID=A0A5S3P573_9SPHN|nr:hypothetical protein [Qipengyuania marisflavi]TMM48189.1 hypothetical protein FEV51_07805 [Qipengyuania marisflavi]